MSIVSQRLRIVYRIRVGVNRPVSRRDSPGVPAPWRHRAAGTTITSNPARLSRRPNSWSSKWKNSLSSNQGPLPNRVRSTSMQQVIAEPTTRTAGASRAAAVSDASGADTPMKWASAPAYWTVSGARA